MNGSEDAVQPPVPDLDELLDAVVALVEAATYADAVRRADEIAITSAGRRPPAGAMEFRRDAGRAEERARDALYGLLDHERVIQLIPRLSRARYFTANRAEDAYEALVAAEQAQSAKGAAAVDGDADGVS